MSVEDFVGSGMGWFMIMIGIVGAVALNLWRWWQDRALAFKLRLQPGGPVPLEDTPTVSILVAAWSEGDKIEDHLRSILALSYPHKEVLLCAGGSDDTLIVARRVASEVGGGVVKVLEQHPGEGKQHALKRLLELATGQIIYLTDADCVLDDVPFTRTLAALINDGERVVTGYAAPLLHQRHILLVLSQWYIDHYSRAFSPRYVGGLIGRNAAIWRETLDKVGGFSEPVKIGTDYFLAQKLNSAGERIRYVSSAVETEFKASLQPYFRQQSRWLRNILLHGQSFKKHDQVSHALRQCLVGAGIILWPLTWPLTGWLGVWLWGVAVLYGTLSRLRYIRFGEISLQQPSTPALYLLAPVHFLIDQLMLAYALLEWVLPNRRWKW
jgi:cellulose synthase/poly-beta-1,6-N-acetylglucosamine synthase-like glycosyltransferase